ncbi:UNVERIFIED_CONTAM: hypothetical protein Slati_2200000 [Sesamum latifolium]|uniref:Uncharacterized protein n=1 Tax=Sesamum latifolium TaxID=2727402 RepID=A0AAW2WTP6_9LAMI
METPSAPSRQKARPIPVVTTQALQVVSSTSLTPISGSMPTATPRSTDPPVDPPRTTISSDAPPVELSSNLLGTIQQMIASTIREQLAVLIPARVTTPSEVTVPKQADPALAVPRPNTVEGPTTQLPTQVGDVPPNWLARLEYLQKRLQDVQYQVMGAPSGSRLAFPLLKE